MEEKQWTYADKDGLKVVDLDGQNEKLIVPINALPDGDDVIIE